MRKLILVLSDLHIGSGHRKGQVNLYDDFREDGRLEQLLSRYARRYAEDELHLVLNGDIFDLLKVPLNGKFPDAISERLALSKLEQCLTGHPRVVRALRQLLEKVPGARVVYQPGNHDQEFFFPGVQRMFCRALTGHDTHPRVAFISEQPFFELDGIQFHHGHQFEAIHALDFKKLFITRGQREPILNLPWGSLFHLHVLNRLLVERPYLDKVMPFWPLFVGGMIFDTRFTLKMVGYSALGFAAARVNPNWWQKRPFEKALKFVRNEVRFFEALEEYAQRIIRQQPHVQAVFMGHTHCEMLRTYPQGKTYVNTGSWTPMINLRVANLGSQLTLHYGLVKWNQKGEPRVKLMRWHGTRPLTEEVIF